MLCVVKGCNSVAVCVDKQLKQLNQEHLSSTCTVIKCWVEIIASRCRDTKMNSCITVMPRHIIKCLIENQENAVKKTKLLNQVM